MAEPRCGSEAFGGPGIEPRWTHGGKDGVGTAYAAACRVWFTLWNGALTEVYYPRVDRPQTRDLQLLVTDGSTFFHEEKRDLLSTTDPLDGHALGYAILSEDPAGRYRIRKEVITAPHAPCVLQHVRLEGDDAAFLDRLRLYVLCAPHLAVGGWNNDARVVEVAGRRILAASRDGTWLALAATRPFTRLSCGFVGASDGWTDLHEDFTLDWEFECAMDGNVALTGEVAGPAADPFTVGLAFGESLESAATTLFQSLSVPFDRQRRAFMATWSRHEDEVRPLHGRTGDGGRVYRRSHSLLLAHEDKTFPGALIASLSIPWGEVHGEDDQGGYHLVWTRDLVNSAGGLLAADHADTARRALVYLAVAQHADGGFPQNFWLDGRSYWQGVQLDEVAFPILLSWRIEAMGALLDFDPWPMVRSAASFLVRNAPVTEQERWEEASGYSPSTLAATAAALVCAGDMARRRGEPGAADYLEEFADFIECHVESWTVTTRGTLLHGVPRHYVRIAPVDPNDPSAEADPDGATLRIANRPPGARTDFPARDVVDAGFLELVRYGLRAPDTALMEDSLAVVDAVLRVETPAGPVWRRYNHDGYGQRDDGGAYDRWGVGRAWPLLTGERGHYEVAAGRDAHPYLHTLERLATRTGMLTEQVWDGPDRPDVHMYLGAPTGAAMPLMWAHAEYVKLLRSVSDGAVFDRIPLVADRYLGEREACRRLEVWTTGRRPRSMRRDAALRIQAAAPFRLRWTADEWSEHIDTPSRDTGLGVHYADLRPRAGQRTPFRFTFFWTDAGRWEGRDFAVEIDEDAD